MSAKYDYGSIGDTNELQPLKKSVQSNSQSNGPSKLQSVHRQRNLHHPNTNPLTQSITSFLHTYIFTMSFIQIILIILYATTTTYGAHNPLNQHQSLLDSINYQYLKDVSVMIFIGFGFLMTFLRKYGYSAVAFTLYTSVYVVEVGVLMNGFFNCIKEEWKYIGITNESIIQGLFCAAAILITFGGIIGKVTPSQLLILVTFEIFFYFLNNYFIYALNGIDMGGSISIHMFGAYFGIASSLVFTKRSKRINPVFDDCSNSYISDLFSFIGTVFLWIYWPSFNGGVAGTSRFYTTINTLLSLCASCVMAFWTSARGRSARGGRFDVVDIQNATLAGGVAIGTVSNLPVHPAIALVIGSCAGCLSVFGYIKVQHYLEKRLNIHDTCGINNLHGMPSILGGVASIFIVAYISYGSVPLTNVDKAVLASSSSAPFLPSSLILSYVASTFPARQSQWFAQLFCIIVTLLIAIVSGYFASLVTLFMSPYPSSMAFFTDEIFWTIPETIVSFTKDDVTVGYAVPRALAHRASKAVLGKV